MLALLPPVIGDNLQWLIPAAIVVLGLFVYGFGDLIHFSFGRVWAISQVCFDESIRRRVLWITPLAIVGALLVSQFQKPLDEQDAIRQTIKFTLFAAGLVVTTTAVILACTNLPREIESRVIYTIVTKPTTRLEIVLGKVVGFAKVSATILVIMGAFTLVYLHARAWSLRRDIQQRLADGTIDPMSRATYEYSAQHGLLGSRSFQQAANLQIFAREPDADTRRWFFGSGDGDIVVPFYMSPEQLIPAGAPDAKIGDAGLVIQVRLGFAASKFDHQAPPAPILPIGVAAPAAPVEQGPATQAMIGLELLDENLNSLGDMRGTNGGKPMILTDPSGNTPLQIFLPREVALNILRSPLFYVCITGVSRGVAYSADLRPDPDPLKNPICLIVPGASNELARLIGPVDDGTGKSYQPAAPTFRGHGGLYGQQLRGGKTDVSPVAVYQFRGGKPRSSEQPVNFELRGRIEHGGSDDDDEGASRFQVIAVSHKTGQRSEPVFLSPENSRTAYFSLPGALIQDGDFDVYIRNLTSGQFAGLKAQSLSCVASEESFDANLLRSLSILWMLSILVVVISIFCSTFLSWPIAIVLTLLLLLGHWGIMQVSDSLAPGIGNMVAQDLFGVGNNASQAKVVSDLTEAMARVLNQLANVLPDIGQFSAIDDIEQGITISLASLTAPLSVLAAFGLPMLVLSYVFLRNKEVAP